MTIEQLENVKKRLFFAGVWHEMAEQVSRVIEQVSGDGIDVSKLETVKADILRNEHGDRQQAEQVLQFIEGMKNEKYKTFLKLRYLEELTNEEIAARMFYSVDYVNKIKQKIEKPLKEGNG